VKEQAAVSDLLSMREEENDNSKDDATSFSEALRMDAESSSSAIGNSPRVEFRLYCFCAR